MSQGRIDEERKTPMQNRLQLFPRLGALAAVLVLTACGGGNTGTATASGTAAGAEAQPGAGAMEAAQRLGSRRHPRFVAPANQAPFAVAALKGEAVMQNASVLDASGSTDPDGSIVSRSWAYGDGETGTADAHVYKQPGRYVAVLTVTDDQGATGSAALAVTVAKCSAAGSAAAAATARPTVCMQTSQGEMVIELFPAEAPVTAANFLTYVDEGFYAGTLIHRVIPNFVIQGGGFNSGLKYKAPTHAAIPLESSNGLKNLKYTLSMARTDAPNSATSQFFVNLVDNASLNYNPANPNPNGYAVFGQVIHGTSVVQQIATVPTVTYYISNGVYLYNVPRPEVVIRSAVRLP